MKKSKKIMLGLSTAAMFLSACGNKLPASGTTASAESAKEETQKTEETQDKDKNQATNEKETNSQENAAAETENKDQQFIHLQASIKEKNLVYCTESGNTLASVKRQKICLGEEEALRYPQLAKTLNQRGEELFKEADDTQRGVIELADQYEADREGVDADLYRKFYDETESYVYRADSAAFSVLTHYDSYSGGVHGYYAVWAENYDTESGKLLKLTDVVTDMDQFTEQVFENLLQYYPDLGFEEKRDEILETTKHDISWSLGSTGVTIYYNPYEIGCYADGMQMVNVEFKDYPELFVAKYSEAPDSWILPFGEYEELKVDVDGDGTLDRIFISYDTDEYDTITSWTLSVNGGLSGATCWSWKLYPYVIKKEEKCYLYLFSAEEDDIDILQVYDLTDGTAQECGEMYVGNGSWTYDTDTEIGSRTALTDPDNMILDSRVDCLSTAWAYKTYQVGNDGMPTSSMNWYLVTNEHVLTLLKPMDFEIVGEDGNTLSKRTLNAGAKCEILRTDDDAFCDFRLESGEIGRVYIDREKWPTTVNGEPADEVFGGMIFAG